MDKIKEKTIALMFAIDDVYFDVVMKSRENHALSRLARILGDVHEYLESFSQFCENNGKIDELLNSTDNGQENSNSSGKAE